MRTAMAVAALLLFTACEDGLETRTFRLQHMQADEAMMMIEPYVPGGAENLRMTQQPASLTVTAPEIRLEQIAEVLAAYDRPQPNVRLRFQIIEANGFTGSDPAIADVEEALRGLFRFQGYRLVSEVAVQARAPGRVRQQVAAEENGSFTITAIVDRVTRGEEGGAVELTVSLASFGDAVIETSLTVPGGQTVVVGSARARPDGNTIILVVRPEIQ